MSPTARSAPAHRSSSLLRFFPASSSHRLRAAAVVVHHSNHHLPQKSWSPFGSFGVLGAIGFHLETSNFFRRLTVLAAIILAFLPTIEVPVSVAAPCWLSFVLEILCYSILTLRIICEFACQTVIISRQPFFSLLALSLVLCWIDVIICLAVIANSGGDLLSWNSCAMPEGNRTPRASGWVYLVCRFSRFLRPVMRVQMFALCAI